MSTDAGSESRGGWFTPFLMVACVALCATVVMMNRTIARQSKDRETLRARIDAVENQLAAALKELSLQPGKAFRELTVVEEDGSNRTVRFGTAAGGRTLLFVASHGCDACAATVPAWATVMASPHANCSAMLVYLDDAELAPHGGSDASSSTTERETHTVPGVRTCTVVDARSTVLGGLRLVPATILINGDGRIENVWYGLLTDDDIVAITRAAEGAG